MGKKETSELYTRLKAVNDEMEFYVTLFNIPESKQDDSDDSDYLLDADDAPKKHVMEKTKKDTDEDKTHKVEVKQNKITSKHLGRKGKAASDKPKKVERLKLKKEKKMKKMARKQGALIAIKQEQERSKLIEHKPLPVKQEKKPGPIFNAEGKIVFSKVQLDESDVKKKGIETDTKKLLKKVLDNKKQLAELKESGDLEKYGALKNKQAWEKAMAKTAGEKVRDDPELLLKKIHQRKKQIQKSKEQWKDRAQKIEHQQKQRQKERNQNLMDRAQKKKNTKLKQMAKRGRVIPGF